MNKKLLEFLVTAVKKTEESKYLKIQAVKNQNFEKAAYYRSEEKNYEEMVEILLNKLSDEQGED